MNTLIEPRPRLQRLTLRLGGGAQNPLEFCGVSLLFYDNKLACGNPGGSLESDKFCKRRNLTANAAHQF